MAKLALKSVVFDTRTMKWDIFEAVTSSEVAATWTEKVYYGLGEQSLHHWAGMIFFSCHSSLESAQVSLDYMKGHAPVFYGDWKIWRLEARKIAQAFQAA